MRIVNDYPPNYQKIKKAFNLDPDNPMIFTYGEDIYDPSLGGLDAELIEHEWTHKVQQLEEIKDIDKWWDMYIKDPEFRLSQELEAYRYQYKFFCFVQKDRNKRNLYLVGLAYALSGPNYGSIISYKDATLKIKEGIK